MLSMRAAAALLASATSLEALGELLQTARLTTGPCAMLDDASLRALGIDGAVDVRIAGGVGAVRALLLDLAGEQPMRPAVERVVSRLAARAPHVLWLLAVRHAASGQSAIVGWRRADRSRRIAAFIWEPARPVDSDAETLCALHAAHGADDELVHARTIGILGREALTRRFYRALEAHVDALSRCAPVRDPERARAVTLLHVSRLLFLSFLEAKGWLNGERGFLAERFDACMAAGGGFHRRVLLPLFFGTLNTPVRRRAPAARAFGRVPFLNGGLFTRAGIERGAGRWTLPDEQLGALFADVFLRFRFVAREDSATWSEASVDPEMLGRAFESLMSNAERKSGGVFFTPHRLVGRLTEEALAAWVEGGGSDDHAVRVLDPACGSGAFLVHVLERLAARRAAAGDPAPVAQLRREILARSIFGVDRNPTAVWLCELRLWLSVVIELEEPDPLRVPPLPNLDRNIRVGDALAGAAFDERIVPDSRVVASLRARYVRAVGARKTALARALDREERRRTLQRCDAELRSLHSARREQVLSMRARNLFGERTGVRDKRETRRLRTRLRAARLERERVAHGGALPFSFASMFAEAQAGGGFDLVVGNPPWVRLHRIPEQLRARFRESFQVFRQAPWRSGASRAGASAGFASQVDLAALFVERSVRLLRRDGVLALVLPVKLWRSLAGGGVRQLLLDGTRLLRLEDLSGAGNLFEAAVYPSLLVARASDRPSTHVTLALAGARSRAEWSVSASAIPFDGTPGAPWLLLPPEARAAFTRLRDAGVPLAESPFGPPRLGVKSGCNAAFVVRVVATTASLAVVQDVDGERGKVESRLLRPALRGDAVCAWRRRDASECVIWTHDGRGPLAELPPHARRWLGRRYGALATRSDVSRARRWWSLFRVDAAACDVPRLVWADFGRRPRALVLPPGDPAVPLNSCYVLRLAEEADAWALAAVLNSAVAAAWLNALAEPARGGYRRYLGWTVGHLPLPRDWTRVRDDLAALGARAASERVGEDTLTDHVLAAYALSRADVAPLLATCDP